jgi:hypothetical protein
MQPLSLPAETAALQRLCSERPSVVVAEGLLMYLSPRPLLRLLRALARQSNPPELWLSALSPEHPQGRGFGGGRGVTCAWLHAQGEPFRWRIEPERLQALLRRHGYVTEQLWDGAGYGEFVLGARPLQRVDATAPEASRRFVQRRRHERPPPSPTPCPSIENSSANHSPQAIAECDAAQAGDAAHRAVRLRRRWTAGSRPNEVRLWPDLSMDGLARRCHWPSSATGFRHPRNQRSQERCTHSPTLGAQRASWGLD